MLDNARRFNVLNCGRRTGKTMLLERLLALTALRGMPAAYFAPIYPMVEEVYASLETKLARYIERKVQGHRLELSTGGVIDLWSMSNGGDRARGRKYALVCPDEVAMTVGFLRFWEDVVRPTLIDYAGTAWFASTPRRGSDFERLYKRTGDDWRSWTFTTWDNPHISREELEEARRTMLPEAYAREIMADFEASDSELVYNMREDRTIRAAPCEWRECTWRVVGIDPGGGDPTAIVPMGVAKDQQRIHQYGEFYRRGDVTVEMIAEYLTGLGRVDAVVVGETGGNILVNSLQRMGYPAVKADMRREEGIEHVRWLLDSGRLTIGPECGNSIAEFDGYRWSRKRDMTGETYATRTPDWTHADAMDARRYAVMAILNGIPSGNSAPAKVQRPTSRSARYG